MGVLAATVFLLSCGPTSYSDEEIASALARLKPPEHDMSWDEFMVSCALEEGISVPVTVDELGSIEISDASDRDREILQGCAEDADEIFIFPEIEDQRLTLIATYQLQERAAECVKNHLGFDPDLPSLQRYVDTEGDWNIYDSAVPADHAEWVRWNEVCPQDAWHYYKP